LTLAFLFTAGTSDITSRIPLGGCMDTFVRTGRKIETALVDSRLCPGQPSQPGVPDLNTRTTPLTAFGVKQ
jgi:hypothetical protein